MMKGAIKKRPMEKNSELYKYNPTHYCAIYARRSILNNKDNIENQLQSCRNKAKELNLIISGEYFDHESATRFEPLHRPGFKKLVYDLKNNKFKHLIVFKRDRLARKTIHFKEIKYLCKQNNVKLIYAASNETFLDDGSDLASLMENILVSFSELEPENIKLRTKDGIDRKRASGTYSMSAKYPKGYLKLGKGKHAKLIPKDESAPIILYIFESLSKSNLTKADFKNITKNINTKYNLKFTPSTLKYILKTPIYTGYYTKIAKTPIENLLIYDNENNLRIDKSKLLKANNVTPIIKDFKYWENIVTKYFYVNGFSNINPLNSSSCLFSNLLYCKKCSCKVYLINNNFQCVNHCFSIKKETVLNILLSSVISDLLSHKEILKYYNNKMAVTNAQITSIEKQLSIIESKKDKLLLKMIQSKNVNNPYFDNLDKQEKELQTKYNKLKEKTIEYMYYKENFEEKITPHNRNLLVENFILNENMSNDFFKNIIKKVQIDVSKSKFSSDIQYRKHSSSIP